MPYFRHNPPTEIDNGPSSGSPAEPGLTESLRHESGNPLGDADLRQLVLNCLGQERSVDRGTRVSWRGAQRIPLKLRRRGEKNIISFFWRPGILKQLFGGALTQDWDRHAMTA